MVRRSARISEAAAAAAEGGAASSSLPASGFADDNEKDNELEKLLISKDPPAEASSDEDDEDEQSSGHWFEGVHYASYTEMVQAKRQRNHQVLLASGLLSAAQAAKAAQKRTTTRRTTTARRPRKRDKSASQERQLPERKSKRLAGVKADGNFVERESSGKFTIVVRSATGGDHHHHVEEENKNEPPAPEYYAGRVNDGSDIGLVEASELADPRWRTAATDDPAEFVRQCLIPTTKASDAPTAATNDDSTSPRSVVTPTSSLQERSTTWLEQAVQSLSVHGSNNDDDSPNNDDETICVRKVVPERIYGMAVHPSSDRLIVAAGDKRGHVGLWNVVDHGSNSQSGAKKNVDENNDDDDHDKKNHWLFRVHSSAANCLEWTPGGHHLVSSSYDGTVRVFDVQAQTFGTAFATYDDSQPEFKRHLGYGLCTAAESHRYWLQYMMLDSRFGSGSSSASAAQCFFLSTSVGTAMHVDLRVGHKGRITFHEQWSEKKINTLSLHPNGHSMISAGLDCHVKLWDLRKTTSSSSPRKSHSRPGQLQQPIAAYNGGKSVNSAYFSPSGRYVVSTTMNNKLDMFEDFQLASSSSRISSSSRQKKNTTTTTTVVKPYKSLPHDNHTGRWLSTFMAQFHPELDIFCVGSMKHPRQIELFSPAAPTTGAAGGSKHLLRGVEGLTAVASRCCFHPSADRLIVAGGSSSGRVTVLQ